MLARCSFTTAAGWPGTRGVSCAEPAAAESAPSRVGRQACMAAQTPDYAYLAELGQQLRVDAVRCSAAAGSGHPTSSMSAADLMAVLLAGHLRYDFDVPDKPGNDHLIFSRGHAFLLLYAVDKA